MEEITLHWVDKEGYDHYLKFSSENNWEMACLVLEMQAAGIPTDYIR